MILLASQSPQRACLLARAAVAHTVVPSAADEELIHDPDPERLALARACIKSRMAVVTDGVVLGADTVVALDGVDYGKPRDHADARRMLTALSGSTHHVITGHWLAVYAHGRILREASRADCTRVTMRPLTTPEIEAYVASGESMGRCGAYAIQEQGDRFVERLDGAWDTVVGLHLPALESLYRDLCGGPLPRC